jgi:hypothetical protein
MAAAAAAAAAAAVAAAAAIAAAAPPPAAASTGAATMALGGEGPFCFPTFGLCLFVTLLRFGVLSVHGDLYPRYLTSCDRYRLGGYFTRQPLSRRRPYSLYTSSSPLLPARLAGPATPRWLCLWRQLLAAEACKAEQLLDGLYGIREHLSR